MTSTHARLIRDLWPDKALYGAVVLFISGVSGIAYAVFGAAVEVSYSSRVPVFLQAYPAELTVLFSLLSMFFAYRSLRNRSLGPAFLGVASGVLALGLVGFGPLLCLVSLYYTFLARWEREDTNPATLELTSDRWPDKSLAAGLLLMMSGLVTLAWGACLFAEVIRTELDRPQLFGLAGILVGLVSLYASIELYFQRSQWLGAIAAVAGLLTFGFYVVGPMLSGAALVLVVFAWREREFQAPSPGTFAAAVQAKE